MSHVVVAHLRKTFTVTRAQPGVWGAVRGLVAPDRRTVTAVDDVSFTIAPGEVVGYLGPNGAGKSTTLKVLTGLLVPTAGEVRVNGRVPWAARRAHVARLGAVFGQRNTLWWDLPVRDSLELLRHIYRIPAADFQHNLARFCDLLALDEFLHTPVRALSLGQLMRANLAAALLHNPELLLLDEPTIGLDVVAKERIRQFILQLNRERGVTVLLTTHDLADVEKLCERVLLIDHGRLLYDGALEALRARFGGERQLIVDFAEDYAAVAVAGARAAERAGRRVTFKFERDAVTASVLIQRLSAEYRILDLAVREPEIEDTVRRIYEGGLLQPPTPDRS